MKTLTTKNREWGFYGSMSRTLLNHSKAWKLAMLELNALSVESEVARDFLDSPYGRHIADRVCEIMEMDATLTLEKAVEFTFGEGTTRRALRSFAARWSRFGDR